MKKFVLIIASTFFAFQLFSQCSSQKTYSHGKSYNGHEAVDIVDIAIGSDVHTTLVAAVKAADLVGTLKSDGPFTVFAPTNDAFNNLPAGTVETLLKPSNKSALANILTYHVIPTKITAEMVVTGIQAGGGKFTMKAVNGGTLTASLVGKNVYLTDEKGNRSKISATDLNASNGIVHVIDDVVLPN